VVLLAGCANVRDLRHLVIEDARGNETGNEGGEHLRIESNPRRNVGVMGELEILGEAEGVRSGEESEDLKEVHAIGVTGEPETTEQLGNDVEGYFYVGDSLDDTAWNTEDGGE